MSESDVCDCGACGIWRPGALPELKTSPQTEDRKPSVGSPEAKAGEDGSSALDLLTATSRAIDENTGNWIYVDDPELGFKGHVRYTPPRVRFLPTLADRLWLTYYRIKKRLGL